MCLHGSSAGVVASGEAGAPGADVHLPPTPESHWLQHLFPASRAQPWMPGSPAAASILGFSLIYFSWTVDFYD